MSCCNLFFCFFPPGLVYLDGSVGSALVVRCRSSGARMKHTVLVGRPGPAPRAWIISLARGVPKVPHGQELRAQSVVDGDKLCGPLGQ